VNSVDVALQSEVEGGCAAVATLRPRFWAPLVILGLFWSFVVAVEWIEMSMGIRFVSRWIAYGVMLLAFLAWWFADRGTSRSLRWVAIGVVVLGAIVASLLADSTVAGFPLVMSGCPYLLTGWAAWIWATQNLSPRVVRLGLCAVVVLVWGFFDLVRWEGLDGGQHTRLAWRWSATPEQRFLGARAAVELHSPEISAASAVSVKPGDWPRFRGPAGDSRVSDVQISTDWQRDPPKLVWRRRVGPAWSSLCVVDGRLFTQEQRAENEAVVCYDAATGNELWAHQDRERFDEALSGAGPRATPTFAAGCVLALGATGRLNCLDAATGRLAWTHHAAHDAGAATPQWGFSSSPLVVGDRAIVFLGGEAQQLLAYHAQTGEPLWMAPAGKTSFSSPQAMTHAGNNEIVMISDAGLIAFDEADGHTRWHYPEGPTGLALAIAQPQQISGGPTMLVPSGSGVALVELMTDKHQPTVRSQWTSNDLKPSLNDFVVSEQTIFGFDDGIFCAVDLETGNRRWKKGRYGHGQVLLLVEQKLLLVTGENGEVVLLAANPRRHEELGRFQAIDGKTWNHPALVDGRLFVRNAEEMACYDLSSPRR
jgi:outer membrane protein assembly factor BamB